MQTIVGVLRGGPSTEHEVSLKTGQAIIAALPEDTYRVRDIYIDRGGVWHDRGRPMEPVRALRGLDVALIGLHGEWGEDGQVQRLLERLNIPFAGADAHAARESSHKLIAKVRAEAAGIKTAAHRFIEKVGEMGKKVEEIVRSFRQPVVVKPVTGGSSIGVTIAGGYAPVFAAVEELFDGGASGVLVEEYIRGREATVGVIENFRGEKLYSLPVIEIVPPEGDFFSYRAKYSGVSREICPASFSRTQTEELAHAAKAAHRALGLRHYSRSDFIVSPSGVYYLETNALPGLTPESLFPKALGAVGSSLPEFAEHLVNLARAR